MPYNAYSIVQIDSKKMSLKEAFENHLVEPSIVSTHPRCYDGREVKDPAVYGALILGRDNRSFFSIDRATYNSFARARLRDNILTTARENSERIAAEGAIETYALVNPADVWAALRVGTIVEAVRHSDPMQLRTPIVVVSKLPSKAVFSSLQDRNHRGALTATRYRLRDISIIDARTYSVKREHGLVIWRLRYVADCSV